VIEIKMNGGGTDRSSIPLLVITKTETLVFFNVARVDR
jgi:hypothetical protein